MPSRTLPSITLCGFLSVRTAFFASRSPASRTTRHPTPLAFSYFDRQMLVSGLFRLRTAHHGRKSPPGRNRENDVLTDVSPPPCRRNVVWRAIPAGVETLGNTDSVCFADRSEHHRSASSTPGTRFSPTRFARIERSLQPIQSESIIRTPGRAALCQTARR